MKTDKEFWKDVMESRQFEEDEDAYPGMYSRQAEEYDVDELFIVADYYERIKGMKDE